MATSYKTPGVYIEEIPKFPPSIAEVETAIPAFIGYTEKAEKNGEPLKDKPTLIKSIAEFEAYFGKDAPQAITVTLDANNIVQTVAPSGAVPRFYLYDSLRMYFDNGGGRCYIVSVGIYSGGKIELPRLTAGLEKVAKVDEPTLLLSPDAVSLTGMELYEFQKKSIAQCADLHDRFTICDLYQANDTKAGETLDDRVAQFRNGIGISELKYAAAYAPWIKTNLPRVIRFRDLTISGGVSLKSVTSDLGILNLIDSLGASIAKVNEIKTDLTNGLTSANPTTLDAELKSLFEAYTAVPIAAASNPARAAALKGITSYLATVFKFLSATKTKAIATQTLFPELKLGDDLTNWSGGTGNTTYLDLVKSLITNVNGADAVINDAALKIFPAPATAPYKEMREFFQPAIADLAATNATDTAFYTSVSGAIAVAAEKPRGVQDALRDKLKIMAPQFLAVINKLVQTAKDYETAFDDALVARFGFYKTMLNSITGLWNVLPPSGSIAGIYCRVDNARGVWKAPANESLNSVIEPDVLISHKDQESLNVDVNAGKSINAIRTFTGKGVLVWGGRTLAGNDNEWRYISVRRFFNMVEESTKKATEQFVFEPNDANTWVRVQAMIENYLTTLWRAGALQGAKPEHAFYVAVGLGTTMTALDILEGRMIVEIGMAVVRPAEFIILRFSHKMAES